MKVTKTLQLDGDIFVVNSKEIGEGSFAKVYKGVRKRDGRFVAIKAIPKTKVQHSQKLVENLYKEVEILRKMDHPNVVKVHAFHVSNNRYYIVMDFCEGGDLSEYIKDITSTGKLAQYYHISRRFLIQTASALKKMRDMRVVHRDLKPLNLLLSSKNYRDSVVKIADFGFARELSGNSMIETYCGSPLYMAPEILEGMAYTSNAELWSFGVIAFELLTGIVPYNASNIVQLTKVIRENTFKFPADLPHQAKDLIVKLLEKDPSKRISYEQFFVHPFLNNLNDNVLPNGYIHPAIPSQQVHRNSYFQKLLHQSITHNNGAYNPSESPFHAQNFQKELNLKASKSDQLGDLHYEQKNDELIQRINEILWNSNSTTSSLESNETNDKPIDEDFIIIPSENELKINLEKLRYCALQAEAIQELANEHLYPEELSNALLLLNLASDLLNKSLLEYASKLAKNETLHSMIPQIRDALTSISNTQNHIKNGKKHLKDFNLVLNPIHQKSTKKIEDIIYKKAHTYFTEAENAEKIGNFNYSFNRFGQSLHLLRYLAESEILSKDQQSLMKSYVNYINNRLYELKGRCAYQVQ